jgi:hypothetical protein
MIPPTAHRIAENTPDEVNEQIRRRTKANVARFAEAHPAAINRRLKELDQEWDIERWLEAVLSTFTLIGLGLGVAVNRKWLLLPLVVQAFFLEHALQGWCPPVPVLRRFGVRTADEIDEERNAIKALRGDYRHVAGARDEVQRALLAAQR